VCFKETNYNCFIQLILIPFFTELTEKKVRQSTFLEEIKDIFKRETATISRQALFMLQIFSEGVRLA
jgi:hypothetical protein